MFTRVSQHLMKKTEEEALDTHTFIFRSGLLNYHEDSTEEH